jgi:hypothetical protein
MIAHSVGYWIHGIFLDLCVLVILLSIIARASTWVGNVSRNLQGKQKPPRDDDDDHPLYASGQTVRRR